MEKEKEKKQTAEQLRKRIERAQLIVERGPDFKAFNFADRGISIYICKDFVIESTLAHQHVWNKVIFDNQGGMRFSEPCIFLERVVELANLHKDSISEKDAEGQLCYSFDKLTKTEGLTEGDKSLLSVADSFLSILSDAPFAVGTGSLARTSLYTQYYSLIARVSVILEQKDEDDSEFKNLSINDFFNKYISLFRRISLYAKLDDVKLDAFSKEVDDAEKEAYERICRFVNENGGEMVEMPALPEGLE